MSVDIAFKKWYTALKTHKFSAVVLTAIYIPYPSVLDFVLVSKISSTTKFILISKQHNTIAKLTSHDHVYTEHKSSKQRLNINNRLCWINVYANDAVARVIFHDIKPTYMHAACSYQFKNF